LPAAEEPEKRRKQSLREFFVVTYFEIPRVAALWMKTVIKGGFAGNRQALTAWRGVLFTDFILKCDCSFPDKFFVTGRFQVGFVLDKSEIAL